VPNWNISFVVDSYFVNLIFQFYDADH
jgi:hypothetical protein